MTAPKTGEFFRSLAKNIPAGREDTFTALLATTVQFVPGFGSTILRWLAAELPNSDLGVPDDARLNFSAQVERGPVAKYGTALLDMVATVSKDEQVLFEVWFEHKLDSPLGEREAKDNTGEIFSQIQKYVEIAKWYSGQNGQRRIFVVYCSRDKSQLNDRASSLPSPNAYPVALLNRSESFRWFSLHEAVVREMANRPLDQFQKWLFDELSEFWRQPGMYSVRATKGWLPTNTERARGTETRDALEQTWSGVTAWLSRSHKLRGLRGNPKGDHNWVGVYHRPAKHPHLYQLHFIRATGSEFAGWPPNWPGEALRCEFTFHGREGAELCKQPMPFDAVGPRTKRGSDGRKVLAFGLPVSGWTNNPKQDSQALATQAQRITEELLKRLELQH